MNSKVKAPRNRTLEIKAEEVTELKSNLVQLKSHSNFESVINKTILGDLFKAAKFLPQKIVDLLIIDPPYNLTKKFNNISFKSKSVESYSEYLEKIILCIKPLLKDNASIYVCGDWLTSASIYTVLDKHFIVRNRITWEREKGRGANNNWKNNTEDIWFCTAGKEYKFNVDKVKLKRKVLAPYKLGNGEPKDWDESSEGKFRLTHPSNIWTDISIPFWSMPENTEHPTQKPEKLIAKMILASSDENDVVFDPFLGSGTTSVTAKKLNRNFIGIEVDEHYACISEKRLKLAEKNNSIQGYDDGVFWERNTLRLRKNNSEK